MDLTSQQKFEAIKYRHEDQSKVLHNLTNVDLKIIISFFSLQIALGGFLSQIETEVYAKMGILIIDIAISIVCIVLLFFSYKRRKEAVGTLKNCNKALGFDEIGFYIKDEKINYYNTENKNKVKLRPWFWWYFIGIITSIIGIVIILFLYNS